MLKRIPIKLTLLFIVLVIFELITIQLNSPLHYISKPLIVGSLIFLFIKKSEVLTKFTKNCTIAALLFSVLGDILLMFVSENSLFFTLGLAAFLLAHVMYIILFSKHFRFKKSILLLVIVLLCYAYFLFTLLQPNLGAMLIPVVIYMLVILCMTLFAFGRTLISKTSYYFVLIGAILFLLSDSILALNKFYKPLFYPDISIMLTYAFAQYFIVLGILKQRH